MPNRSNRQDEPRDKTKIALGLTLVLVLGIASFPFWGPALDNIPWPTWGGIEQGVKLTGTVNYANHSAVDSETVQFVDAETMTATYTAAISGGSFITNRGPIDGGLFYQYISLGDTMMYVNTIDVPAAEDYDHEAFTVDDAVIYTNAAANGWSALMTGGAIANAFTGGGAAATNNYTASAGTALAIDLKLTLSTNYAKLFREYTDPFDGIAIEPCLWIQTTSAVGVYAPDATSTFESWTAGNYTYFLMPISQLMAPSAVDVDSFHGIDIVFSSTGWYEFNAYVIDGSSFAYLLQAKSQIANPNSGETVTVSELVDAFVIVS